uniref:Uncharacterized protein n=1 Tax=Oryza meridionalis TaxID=40149 RepID=A0A0E0EKD9_9ORYZ
MKLHQQRSTVVVPTVIVAESSQRRPLPKPSPPADLQPVPRATVAHNPSRCPSPELSGYIRRRTPATPRALPRSEPPLSGSVALAAPRAPLSAGSVAHDRATAQDPPSYFEPPVAGSIARAAMPQAPLLAGSIALATPRALPRSEPSP